MILDSAQSGGQHQAEEVSAETDHHPPQEQAQAEEASAGQQQEALIKSIDQKEPQQQLTCSTSKTSNDTTDSPTRLEATTSSSSRSQEAATEMPSARNHQTSELAASLTSSSATDSADSVGQSLVDRLIDSQLEWRQIIREANGSERSLSQLSELQIKRQEVIHELVQTERHHCLTLALMRQVYLSGLKQLNESRCGSGAREPQPNLQHLSANTTGLSLLQPLVAAAASTGPKSQKQPAQQQQQQQITQSPPNPAEGHMGQAGDLIDLERLFPALEDLIQAHELFFAHLRLQLVESCRASAPPGRLIGLVGPLGDLLCDQFRLRPADEGPGQRQQATAQQHQHHQQQQQQQTSSKQANGQKLLQAYAKFCGQHYDSSRYYKHLMQNDKGFKQFIEQCNKQNASCRQRGIPECNLLVTQRLTKYPLLIEQLIKTSKDDPEEEQKLREALGECKSLLGELNNQLARKESFERLLDIYAQFSPKSYTIYNRHLRFTKHDLLQHKRLRQLLHSDGQIRIWSATRRKLFQVLCLILNDIVVFLRIESSSAGAQSANANHLHHQHLSEVQPEVPAADQLVSLPHGQGSFVLASNPNFTSIQPPSLVSAAASGAAGSASLTSAPANSSPSSSSFSIKYYFANIDNKSSVISLSKLLVREKAATDQEPRVYLISSSPRQPEMYELAFLSKRHQTSFVEKLKACVEQHNKALEGHEDPLAIDDDFVLNDDDEQLELALGHGNHLGSGCLCDEQDDEQQLYCGYGEEGEEECDECAGRLDSATLDDDEEDDEEDEEEAKGAEEAHHEMGQRFARARSSSEANCGDFRAGGESMVGRRKSGATELDDFELDIEQDVVPEPNLLSSGEEPSSFTYTSGHEGRKSDSQAALGASSEGARPSSSEPEASNESGLSERAKDSLDEAAPSKQKLRTNRRRRAQRPRNVSNQSSSSSEAAHRQAIQLISCSAAGGDQRAATTGDEATTKYEEEFDSGRGHDDSSSAASTSSNSLGSRSLSGSNSCHQLAEPKLATSAGCKESSETAANGSSKKEKKSLLKTCVPGHQILRGAGSDKVAQQDSQTASCASSTASGSTVANAAKTQTTKSQSGSNLIKCSSILSKSSCSFMKQRKLSTVSTMSSQLKLISKLKSNLSTEGSHLCSQQQQQQQQLGQHQYPVLGGGYCCCASQHSTLSKQMRQQMRRSTFVPEQKLEELRDLRIQLDKDKQEWQAKFDRMQEQLLNERRELDLAREKLKQDRQQVANEREQLYRKLDVLKEKGILLSPSHKVIITTPELRIYPPNGTSPNDNFIKQNYGGGGGHQHQAFGTNHNQLAHHYSNNGNAAQHNQRQPLHHHQIIGQDNHSSTIQIVNQSSAARSYSSQQQLVMSGYPNGSATFPTGVATGKSLTHTNDQQHHISARGQQRPTTNLFLQSGAKVPLHLSEGSAFASSGSQKSSSSSSSMSLMSKVSLIGSTGTNLLAERLCGSSNKLIGGQNVESHVI